jgi:hypothetical protein
LRSSSSSPPNAHSFLPPHRRPFSLFFFSPSQLRNRLYSFFLCGIPGEIIKSFNRG